MGLITNIIYNYDYKIIFSTLLVCRVLVFGIYKVYQKESTDFKLLSVAAVTPDMLTKLYGHMLCFWKTSH